MCFVVGRQKIVVVELTVGISSLECLRNIYETWLPNITILFLIRWRCSWIWTSDSIRLLWIGSFIAYLTFSGHHLLQVLLAQRLRLDANRFVELRFIFRTFRILRECVVVFVWVIFADDEGVLVLMLVILSRLLVRPVGICQLLNLTCRLLWCLLGIGGSFLVANNWSRPIIFMYKLCFWELLRCDSSLAHFKEDISLEKLLSMHLYF